MSSQKRVDPFQTRPESGPGGRWPITWRPGTSVEGGTRFWPSDFRVYPILAIALLKNAIHGGKNVMRAQKCEEVFYVLVIGDNEARPHYLQ